MALATVRLPVGAHLGLGGIGGSSLCGEPVPSAIPFKKLVYGDKHVSLDGKRQSCGGARAYVTDGSELDHFATLGVGRGASKNEIKTAYRKLARQYHPDVCRGESCTRKFIQINAAYERALNGNAPLSEDCVASDDYVEGCMGVDDDSWDEWEEWMGFEGAGTRDYSTHINVNVY